MQQGMLEASPLHDLTRRYVNRHDESLLVASNWIEPRPGQQWAHHRHPDHELLWGVDGTVVADVGGERFTVPPHQALWIPTGCGHQVINVSATRFTCTWLSAVRRVVGP